MSAKIKSVDAIPLRIPFKEGVTGDRKSSVDVVLVRIHSDQGTYGIGETQAWRRQGSAEYLPNVVNVIRDLFAPVLIGRSPFDVAAIMRDLEKTLYGSFYPQAAVGDALHDLAARLLNISLAELLGGRCRETVRVGLAILFAGDIDRVCSAAQAAYDRGYRHLRLKLGPDINENVTMFKELRRMFGAKVALRADANGALRFDRALLALRAVLPFDLEMVEQPVGTGNLAGMAALSQAIPIPLSADESLSSEASLVEIIRWRAASMIQTKIGKNGGVYYCKRLWTIAEAAGLSPLAGNHPTTTVAATAMAHLVASWPTGMAVGEFSNGPTDVLADDIVTEPMRLQNGTITISKGPGLGLEVNERKLAMYRAD